ncbi:MAG TPA: hypothetical protein VF541_19040 [Longimicrobium sp.]|jgi:hypothetical protein
MEANDIVKFMVICSVVVVPALGITARFALKPIVDAILRLKEGGVLPSDNFALREVTTELQHLRAEVAEMKGEMARLQDVQGFHAALREGSSPAPAALPRPEHTPAGDSATNV